MSPGLAAGGPGWQATAMSDIGRFLILLGLAAVAAGVILLFLPRIPWLGRLPGDIVVQRERFTFYFPLATSIVVSLLLTVLLNLFFRR
jgi:hypothetical protein